MQVSEENLKKLIENAYISRLVENLSDATAKAIADTMKVDMPKIVDALLGYIMERVDGGVRVRAKALLDVIGECTCSESYKIRNLCDPECHYHHCKSAIVPLKKALSE